MYSRLRMMASACKQGEDTSLSQRGKTFPKIPIPDESIPNREPPPTQPLNLTSSFNGSWLKLKYGIQKTHKKIHKGSFVYLENVIKKKQETPRAIMMADDGAGSVKTSHPEISVVEPGATNCSYSTPYPHDCDRYSALRDDLARLSLWMNARDAA